MGWRTDASHFTVDSTNHTADGWHDDASTATPAGGGGQISKGSDIHLEFHRRRLRHDDEVIMRVISEFLKAA